ncbi:exonuclease SbcCD subunit D C-terminal domain-containing protein [Massilia sp. PAMC28688]|uniref:exonuclease SbcCD subunit D C-terminal domain-containing protein n=1 Tax=Massilia sp. PAMC28688 TaxID=2861283 RepID=UPI001C639DAA|nr:exonuclease SbcCD subunit D C-terminal domain-containing protein [Massilia sp. PAMC28688]QYF92540.1 exonuclease SbcCD subunit D C-terminal domain-containing protein [Massilia sp. PAMC28688]
MRLLHTSDWHLGQTLHNYERSYEHQCFLDWLLDTIVAEQVDALLIAGDVFDTANPSSAAQKQLYRFLQQARARAPQLDIVVIAGNHDSPGRLEAPGPLLEAHATHVIGHVLRTASGEIDVERHLVPLHAADGSVGALCLAIPFLRPGDVPRMPAAEDGAAPLDPYLGGISLLYQQAYALASSRRQPGQAIVAMGHCHMVDGTASTDSERRIVIGNTEALPAAMFDPGIAYAALGHLHLSQRVGKKEHLRYCGSPLPLSFSEVQYQHQVLRIDLEGGVAREVTPLMVPRAVQLMRVPPRPAPLDQVLAALEALELEQCAPHLQPYLEVRVLLDAPEPGLRGRIEAALRGKPVRLAKIEPTRKQLDAGESGAAMSLDQLAQLQPDDIFRRLYLQRHGSEAPEEQLRAFAELLAMQGSA